MLKTVENLGVSHVKGTEQYQSKLEAEIRRLKFSFRVSKSGKEMFFSLYIFIYLNLGCGKYFVLSTGLLKRLK